MMPLARTPWDEKGGNALDRYAKRLQRMIESFAPWLKRRERERMKGVKPGEVVVMLDADEASLTDNPLFAGATIIK